MRLTKRVECSQDDCRCSLEKAPTCQMSRRFRRMQPASKMVEGILDSKETAIFNGSVDILMDET